MLRAEQRFPAFIRVCRGVRSPAAIQLAIAMAQRRLPPALCNLCAKTPDGRHFRRHSYMPTPTARLPAAAAFHLRRSLPTTRGAAADLRASPCPSLRAPAPATVFRVRVSPLTFLVNNHFAALHISPHSACIARTVR